MNDSLAIYLSQALEDDCDKRSKIQKDVITKFLKEQSDFGAFLPKGLVSQTFVDDLHLLRDRCKFQFVNKDQKIFSKGEYMDSCYIIIQGNVVCETEKVGVNRKVIINSSSIQKSITCDRIILYCCYMYRMAMFLEKSFCLMELCDGSMMLFALQMYFFAV